VYKKQDHKSRDKLFFKLLDVKTAHEDHQSQSFSQLIKVNSQQTLENSVNQLRNNLMQLGYKNVSSEEEGTSGQAVIQLEEYQCRIIIRFDNNAISIEGSETPQFLRKVSEIAKKSFKLI